MVDAAEFASLVPLPKLQVLSHQLLDDEVKMADRLLEYAGMSAQYFVDDTKDPCAAIRYLPESVEVVSIDSEDFRGWLLILFQAVENHLPNDQAVRAVQKALLAKTRANRDVKPLGLRVALLREGLCYDLHNEYGEFVQIDEHGWRLLPCAVPRFRWRAHMQTQVTPTTEREPLDTLFKFINVSQVSDTGDMQMLLKVWLVTAFLPHIPHPILILHGVQGTAKTCAFRILRRIIDPSIVETLSFPDQVEELVLMLNNHYCTFFDNMTYLNREISDTLCRAVTGLGFSKRALYTNNECVTYSFRRHIGLNGINIPAEAADLLDRTLMIELKRIEPRDRITEYALFQDFEQVKPGLLASIFDALSKAMQLVGDVKLTEKPRMADFAIWGEAVARALGYPEGLFLKTYLDNVQLQTAEVLESNIVGIVMVKFLAGHPEWRGTASDLYSELQGYAIDANLASIDKKDPSRTWPKTAAALVKRLKEVTPALIERGYSVGFTREAGTGTRMIHLGPRQATLLPEKVDFSRDFPHKVVGEDGKTYGPFHAGELAEMPTKLAAVIRLTLAKEETTTNHGKKN